MMVNANAVRASWYIVAELHLLLLCLAACAQTEQHVS
jgi:hypothetical protein